MVFACARRTSYDEAKEIYENNKELLQKYADDFKEHKRYHEIARINIVNRFYIPLPGANHIASEYVIYLEVPGKFGYERHEIEFDEETYEIDDESWKLFNYNYEDVIFFTKYAKFLNDLDLYSIENGNESVIIYFNLGSGISYDYGDKYKESVIYADSTESGVEVINRSNNAKKIDDEWFYFIAYK